MIRPVVVWNMPHVVRWILYNRKTRDRIATILSKRDDGTSCTSVSPHPADKHPANKHVLHNITKSSTPASCIIRDGIFTSIQCLTISINQTRSPKAWTIWKLHTHAAVRRQPELSQHWLFMQLSSCRIRLASETAQMLQAKPASVHAANRCKSHPLRLFTPPSALSRIPDPVLYRTK